MPNPHKTSQHTNVLHLYLIQSETPSSGVVLPIQGGSSLLSEKAPQRCASSVILSLVKLTGQISHNTSGMRFSKDGRGKDQQERHPPKDSYEPNAGDKGHLLK